MAKPQKNLELKDHKQPTDDAERSALPPGHPTAWQILTEGTILEGTDYPLPVFL